MIEYIKGDLIQAFDSFQEPCYLLHQENCTSLGKKGFAKVLYDKYPEANPNQVMLNWFGEYLLENVNKVIGGHKAIVNLYCQYYPGSPSNVKAYYSNFEIEDNFKNRIVALNKCLDRINALFDEDKTIFMPLIASGLAKDMGLKHDSDLDYFQRYIAPIVEEHLKDFTVKVYYL